MVFPGLIVGALLILGGGKAIHLTSTNEYCISCHIHPMADASWKKSVHYDTRSGYRVACVDCHLPPKGKGYLWAKGRQDYAIYGANGQRIQLRLTGPTKERLEVARSYVYESSCIKMS